MDPLSFKLELLDASAELSDYITQQQVANNAIGTDQLAANAVTGAKIASGAVASNLGFTPASTGKSIAMAIVFGG